MTNLQAFLKMIQFSEGTSRAPDPYRVTFGFQYTIADLSDHPYLLGLWPGYRYGSHIDTAAGAYQIIVETWRTGKAMLKLPDFTAPSQDALAIELLREAGALDLINSGQIAEAINHCGHIWASLPSSPAAQPEKTMAALLQCYGDAGGAFV